jgi:hypothetical protein
MCIDHNPGMGVGRWWASNAYSDRRAFVWPIDRDPQVFAKRAADLGAHGHADQFDTVVEEPINSLRDYYVDTTNSRRMTQVDNLSVEKAAAEARVKRTKDQYLDAREKHQNAVGLRSSLASAMGRGSDANTDDAGENQQSKEENASGFVGLIQRLGLVRPALATAPFVGAFVDVVNFKPVISAIWQDSSDSQVYVILIAVTLVALCLLLVVGLCLIWDGRHEGHPLRPLWASCLGMWVLWGGVAFAVRLSVQVPLANPIFGNPDSASDSSDTVSFKVRMLTAFVLLVLYLMSGAVAIAALVMHDRASIAELAAKQRLERRESELEDAEKSLAEITKRFSRAEKALERAHQRPELIAGLLIADARAHMAMADTSTSSLNGTRLPNNASIPGMR